VRVPHPRELRDTIEGLEGSLVPGIRAAVVEAGCRRVRRCLITTAGTILALLPILTSTGRGANIMIPVATPSFSGIRLALLTMFLVPVLFCWQQEICLSSKVTALGEQ
jgi:Cu(I)/Ag(I) efflux system membrane protein CusA/SilA